MPAHKYEEFLETTRKIRYSYLHFQKYQGSSIGECITEIENLLKILPVLKQQFILEKKMSEENKEFIDFSDIDIILGIKK